MVVLLPEGRTPVQGNQDAKRWSLEDKDSRRALILSDLRKALDPLALNPDLDDSPLKTGTRTSVVMSWSSRAALGLRLPAPRGALLDGKCRKEAIKKKNSLRSLSPRFLMRLSIVVRVCC